MATNDFETMKLDSKSAEKILKNLEGSFGDAEKIANNFFDSLGKGQTVVNTISDAVGNLSTNLVGPTIDALKNLSTNVMKDFGNIDKEKIFKNLEDNFGNVGKIASGFFDSLGKGQTAVNAISSVVGNLGTNLVSPTIDTLKNLSTNVMKDFGNIDKEKIFKNLEDNFGNVEKIASSFFDSLGKGQTAVNAISGVVGNLGTNLVSPAIDALKNLGTEVMKDVDNISKLSITKLLGFPQNDKENSFDTQMERLKANYALIEEKARGNADVLKEIERVKAAEIEKLENKILQARLNSASQYASSLVQIAKDVASFGKASGNVMKGIAISEALINNSLAFIKALASAPPPLNYVLAAAVVAKGAAQIATIKAQSFATGGVVGGNSFYGDRVPIRANSGEMILNKEQQKTLFKIANGEEKRDEKQVVVNFSPHISPSLNAEDVKKMLKENSPLISSFIEQAIATGAGKTRVFV